MNEIIYPMTLDYVPEWSSWEVVRELVTNALDADPGFTLTQNDDGALVIKSKGGELAVRHLLFGVSEKQGLNAVGQFGEGMKLALLVLTRMGLTAHIYSGGRHLWNEPAELEGEQVFKVVWKNGIVDSGQTVVGIPDWEGDTYEHRFIRPGDPRIAYTDPFGRSVLEEPDPNIYVKGVWVQKARGYSKSYAFGYNLTDADMNRDRGVVDAWKTNCEIGKLWASVTDEEMLERFWQAVKDGMGEKDCQMHGVEIGNKRGMRQAFQAVYGQDAVLKTSPEMGREAAYRGAKPVSKAEVGGYGLEQVVEELVGTDAQHVAELEGKAKVYIPDRKLNAEQLKALSVVRRLARRAGVQGRIAAYILPEGILGETNREDVRMSLLALTDPEKAIGTWLHEEAHRMNGTADDTAAHATAIAVLAARVIAGYATR